MKGLFLIRQPNATSDFIILRTWLLELSAKFVRVPCAAVLEIAYKNCCICTVIRITNKSKQLLLVDSEIELLQAVER